MIRRPLRLGIVPCLNVLPLLEGLDAQFPVSGWVRATPRELGGLLAAGEIDAATLPIYDAFRAGTYRLIPGSAIACDGPVRSVQLFSVKPLSGVRRVLLDRSSLTSVHLARILVHDLLRIAPECETSPQPILSDFDLAGSGFDAAVVIGDTALRWDIDHRFAHRLDFGKAWLDLTGLPFVFAAWVARGGLELDERDLRAFDKARRLGESSIPAIAAREAERFGFAPAEVEAYLAGSIQYALGSRQLEAIEEFRRRLVSLRILPASTEPLRMAGPAAAHAGAARR
ncbi:menaquinone biosynthesis protein [Candidatus Poribacteria bacterium]|nr:menaquinone biosynthesis protein [Candidatus Poribacteria bacterium]